MSKQDKKELRQQIACEWLEENYLQFGSLRHDVVTDRLQIKAYKPTPSPSLNGEEKSAAQKSFPLGEDLGEASYWRNLTDKDINTMVCQCVAEKGVNISTNEMWTALKSDMVPAVVIPAMELRDIGKKSGGATLGEAWAQIVNSTMKSASTVADGLGALGGILGDGAKGISGAVKDSGAGAAKNTVDAVGDTTRKAAESIKGLFKGLDK